MGIRRVLLLFALSLLFFTVGKVGSLEVKAATESELLYGGTFNKQLKSLVNQSVDWVDLDETITKIVFESSDVPSYASTNVVVISKEDETYPTWACLYEDVVYIYSDAQNIVFSDDCGSMFSGFAGLKEVQLGEKVIASEITDMSYMFNGCSKLERIDLSGFSTSVTNMHGTFAGCEKIRTLDLSSINMSNVTDLVFMFIGCQSLESILFPDMVIGKETTDMSFMFSNCASLESIDVSKFDTNKVTEMVQMFWGCSSLESIDLKSFNTANAENIGGMFGECSLAKTIDISSFVISSECNTEAMFASNYALEKIIGPASCAKTIPILDAKEGYTYFIDDNNDGVPDDDTRDEIIPSTVSHIYVGKVLSGNDDLKAPSNLTFHDDGSISFDTNNEGVRGIYYNLRIIPPSGKTQFYSISHFTGATYNKLNIAYIMDVAGTYKLMVKATKNKKDYDYNSGAVSGEIPVSLNPANKLPAPVPHQFAKGRPTILWNEIQNAQSYCVAVKANKDGIVVETKKLVWIEGPATNISQIVDELTGKYSGCTITYAAKAISANLRTTANSDWSEDVQYIWGDSSVAENGQTIRVDEAEYLISGDGTASIEKVDTKRKIYKIPETITVNGKNYKVTTIEKKAFINNSRLRTLKIAKTVTKIEEKAVYKCKNLRKIKVNGNTLKKVGKKAFSKHYKNMTVIVTAKNQSAYQKAVKKLEKSGDMNTVSFKMKKGK